MMCRLPARMSPPCRADLSELGRQNDGQDESSVQLTALQSTATSTRSMYEAFLGRLNQTQDREGIQAPDARVISAAEIPDAASFPRKGLAIAISIPAGLMLGLMLAFLVERMDVGFRSVPNWKNCCAFRSLRRSRRSGAPVMRSEPISPIWWSTNPCRPLPKPRGACNWVCRWPISTASPRLSSVTSSVPGEGKTTVATSLARIAAGSGLKTVIVDCDMRRPAATKIVSGASQNGLVEALRGTATLDQCLVKDPKSSAMVLPCLATPPNPSDVLTSKAMQGLIARLRDAFDFVVIDSPPVLPVNDAKILSRLVDTVLFVVRWEKTPRRGRGNRHSRAQ